MKIENKNQQDKQKQAINKAILEIREKTELKDLRYNYTKNQIEKTKIEKINFFFAPIEKAKSGKNPSRKRLKINKKSKAK